MVILSGIPLAENVEKKATDLAVTAMFRGFKYMFRYKSLVKEFDAKIEELNDEKQKVSRRVEEEKDNGKTINEDVLTWQTKVEEIQKKDKELSPSFRCIQCLPIPNLVSRLKLGRDAVKKSEKVTELTASGRVLSDKEKDIAYLPRRSEDVPNANTVFQDFPSRQEAHGKLWKQLVSEDFLILGIYGMPGVGKTRMMEQIWQEAQGQAQKIFNKVTKAIVGSVNYDVKKLQDQLASDLNCNLESKDDTKNRADQLKKSMMNSGKILIIFDDVWGEISLYDIIGTSFDDGNSWKGCKILYTSREELNCLNNKCKDPVEISILEDKEALDLFKNTLGTYQTDSPPNESLVQKVCKKCAGLPLVIYAVGKALKFKTRNLWEDALKKLEDCEIENISGIDPKVYACLKLSFDNLKEDEKQCLLLCSLYAEDAVIRIGFLILLATGTQLVKGGSIRVSAIVDTLKSSSLLLPEGQYFKLHDIIRDVARSIAKKDYAFIIEKCCGRGLSGDSADYAAGRLMQLELENDDFNFPPDFVCPELDTFFLIATRTGLKEQGKINILEFPGDNMFLNLRFLNLQRFYWRPQQLCLQRFNKLKTLIVNLCNIVDTDVSCFPESLETLCIWFCDLPPTSLDFAKLINLRMLEVKANDELQIVPNSISSLSRLEELCLKFPSWVDSTLTSVPKLNEISKLNCLTSLQIYWSDFEPSQDTSIFRTLDKFDIRVYPGPGYNLDNSTRRVVLSGKQQFEGFQNLVERAEEVILKNTNVNISRIFNSNREAFQDLRHLSIEDSDTIEYLVRISPDEIQSIPPPQRSYFSNLSSLQISGCCAMKYLFNNFVAECLLQLQELYISECERMEVIVINESESDGDLINFPKLKVLHLLSLSNLKSFCREKKDMHYPSSTSMMDNCDVISVQPQPQSLFDGMVAFPSLEVLKISYLSDIVSDIWGKKYYDSDNESSSFWKLNSLDVSMCSGLKNVFQHSPMASPLIMHLKKMDVSGCKMMRVIIGTREQEEITDDNIIVFSELTELNLADLPNLSSLSCCQSGETNAYKVKFLALVKLKLEDLEINLDAIELGRDDSTCQLEDLELRFNKEIQLPSAWKSQLFNLERLTLRHCFSDVLISQCFFRRLQFLVVSKLACSTLFSLSVLISLQQLQKLDISNCSMLEEIVEDARSDEVSGMDKKTITLFKLVSVDLKDLPNLKSFFHGANYELHMPALQSVFVSDCGLSTLFTCSAFQTHQQLVCIRVQRCKLLEGIVAADERGIETSETNGKIITLPRLDWIDIRDLPKLKSFIHGANYELHMPALGRVEVSNCGLSTLFTCSAFQKLQQLWFIKVDKCSLLEGIVAADESGIETSDTNGKSIITLSQLHSIDIRDLPNLKSFIHGANYELHTPALEEVEVTNCGLSTLFTCSAFQKLQQLKVISVDKCNLLEGIVAADERGIETSETNDMMITLPQLNTINIGDLPNLKSFSVAVSYAFNMPQLHSFKLRECPSLEYFTSLKTSTGLVKAFSEWHKDGKEVTDLNDYLRQYHKLCGSGN